MKKCRKGSARRTGSNGFCGRKAGSEHCRLEEDRPDVGEGGICSLKPEPVEKRTNIVKTAEVSVVSLAGDISAL